MFDEQQDGDPHGECREEIRRLEDQVRKRDAELWGKEQTILSLHCGHWMPIETAPKDGFRLLLATKNGVVVIGKRNKHLQIWVDDDGREVPREVAYYMPLPKLDNKAKQ